MSWLWKNCPVIIVGLKSRPELNGKRGVTTGWQLGPDGRWPVLVSGEHDNVLVSVKAENLIQPREDDWMTRFKLNTAEVRASILTLLLLCARGSISLPLTVLDIVLDLVVADSVIWRSVVKSLPTSMAKHKLSKCDGLTLSLDGCFKERYAADAVLDTVWRIRSLQELWLCNNKLDTLSQCSSVAQLTSLTFLNVSTCALVSLPDAVGTMVSLRRLWVRDNALAELPQTITKLTRLEELLMAKNNISRLPKGCTALTSLRKLDLSSNKFHDVPPALEWLPGLRLLTMHANPLDACDEHFAARVNQGTATANCVHFLPWKHVY